MHHRADRPAVIVPSVPAKTTATATAAAAPPAAAGQIAGAGYRGDEGDSDDESNGYPRRARPEKQENDHSDHSDANADARSLLHPLFTRVHVGRHAVEIGRHAVPPPSARRGGAVPLGRRAPAREVLAWTAPPAVRR